MARRIEVPMEPVPGCCRCDEAIGKPYYGGGFDWKCRGCLVRWLSGQDEETRRRYFERAVVSIGAESVSFLMQELAEVLHETPA